MANPTLAELKAEQDKLNALFLKNQAAFFEAQKIHNATKRKLTEFNDRYGRALKLFTEVSDGSGS